MKWIKTILIGIAATFAMDILMNALMMFADLTPTNIHPAGAFLYNLGLEVETLSILLHYSYGTLWALVFVYAFEQHFSVSKAILFAIVLWLFMMLVYSPVIGWGFFGIGNAQLLESSHPLYLFSTLDYLIMTLSVHLSYGITLGFLAKKFISQYSGKILSNETINTVQ